MDFLTNKNIQRFILLILFLAPIMMHMYMMLVSQILYYISFEYLNSNKNYLKIPKHNRYNWFFISFVVFVVLVRAHLFNFSETTEYHLNSAEHLYFSGVISLMTLVYLELYKLGSDRKIKKLSLVFITLNLLGLLNEFFQNLFQERPFFSIEGNDIKDMIVNFVGSSVFVILMLYKSRNILPEEI